jgi:hypothetical protein
VTADSTHQTAPAATADDLRHAARDERWVADTNPSFRSLNARADRLEALASLLPALLDTLTVEDLREAAQALFWRAHHHAHNGDEARAEALIASGDALDRAADALAALKEATDG